MNEREMEELKKLLKETLPPMGEKELRRDLWPAMLQRLADGPVRVPWWDWVLLAGSGIVILLFPAIIPALLYQL